MPRRKKQTVNRSQTKRDALAPQAGPDPSPTAVAKSLQGKGPDPSGQTCIRMRCVTSSAHGVPLGVLEWRGRLKGKTPSDLCPAWAELQGFGAGARDVRLARAAARLDEIGRAHV